MPKTSDASDSAHLIVIALEVLQPVHLFCEKTSNPKNSQIADLNRLKSVHSESNIGVKTMDAAKKPKTTPTDNNSKNFIISYFNNAVNKGLQEIENEENAQLVLDTLQEFLPTMTPKSNDPKGEIVAFLAMKGIQAEAVKGKGSNFIEIKPSGTHGKGKEDRIIISVDGNKITITGIGKGSH